MREALAEALSTRHSRFPVLNGDGVLGVVHLSQLARGLLEEGEDAAGAHARGPGAVRAETQPVDELLRQLQARRASMAVVLDEYGDFTGVVTVEDVIEEIVGEIDDERDRAPAVDQQPDGRLVVRGHVSLEDLRDHGVELVDETVTSVGGLVFTRLGRLPRTGDIGDGRRLAPHGRGDPRHAGGARRDRARRAPRRARRGAGQRVG